MEYKIYTDGACSGNPGPGGWAAIILKDKEKKILTGFSKNTTNNIMELKALIEALKYLINLNETNKNDELKVSIYSDSKYIVDGINKWLMNWKKNNWQNSEKKTIKNLKLWKQIDNLLTQINYTITWVKGHDKEKYNNEVDELAKKAIKKLNSTKST